MVASGTLRAEDRGQRTEDSGQVSAPGPELRSPVSLCLLTK